MSAMSDLDVTIDCVTSGLNSIVTELSATFHERREALGMMALAVLTNNHAFILGPPGTAKSAMTRAFFERITDMRYFEQLLSKTRPDQAVLGPYDIPALRAGTFARRIDGYLLTADYAMLDEVGKMSPTLGHDLLAALNERIRHEVSQSGSVQPIPLRSAITASNEMITSESDDAAALWDRLLLRTSVDYIVEPGNFAALLTSTPTSTSATTISAADLAAVADFAIPLITIDTEVIEAVITLRESLSASGIHISDRRWRASMDVVRAAAMLAGRREVEIDDLGALRYTLWDNIEDKTTVERTTLKLSNPLNEKLLSLSDDIASFRASITSRRGKSLAERAQHGTEVLAKLKSIESEVGAARQACLTASRSTERVEVVAEETKALKRQVYVECLDAGDPTELGLL